LRAKKIQCVNNIRQMTLAGFMYCTDHGTMISYNGQNANGNQEWQQFLLPQYGLNTNVQLCPVSSVPKPATVANNNPSGAGTADLAYVDPNNLVVSSYTMNGWFFSNNDPYGSTIPKWEFLNPSGVQTPSTTPIFGDGIWIDTWPAEINPTGSDFYHGTGGGQNGSPASGGGIGRYMINRHGGIAPAAAARNLAVLPNNPFPGAINVGCFDGHAGTMLLDQWESYTWHNGWSPP